MTNPNPTQFRQLAAAVRSEPLPTFAVPAAVASPHRVGHFTPRPRAGRVLLPGSLAT